SAEDLHPVAVLAQLADELETVGPGMPGIDGVEIGLELRDVGAVVRRVERGPKLLHHFAAVVLEYALEAGDIFVTAGEILGDRRDAPVFELLGGVLAERVTRLRRGAARPHEPRVGLALSHILCARDGKDGRARGADIVVDRQSLESRERT